MPAADVVLQLAGSCGLVAVCVAVYHSVSTRRKISKEHLHIMRDWDGYWGTCKCGARSSGGDSWEELGTYDKLVEQKAAIYGSRCAHVNRIPVMTLAVLGSSPEHVADICADCSESLPPVQRGRAMIDYGMPRQMIRRGETCWVFTKSQEVDRRFRGWKLIPEAELEAQMKVQSEAEQWEDIRRYGQVQPKSFNEGGII